MKRRDFITCYRQESLAESLYWLSDAMLVEMIGAILGPTHGLKFRSPELSEECRVVGSGLMRIAEERGWPDGWWEDSSVVHEKTAAETIADRFPNA